MTGKNRIMIFGGRAHNFAPASVLRPASVIRSRVTSVISNPKIGWAGMITSVTSV
jgi:hypothetical protein